MGGNERNALGIKNPFTNEEGKANKRNILLITSFLLLSYGFYFGLSREMAIQLAAEDSLFEYLTAIFFLGTSIVFLKMYFRKRNIFIALLSIVFFIGFGEEISWGQRILGIDTPDLIGRSNIQHEMNLHNLEIFHPQDVDGLSKNGLRKLITVDFLYNLFWFSWCILFPIFVFYSKPIETLADKIKLPVPTLVIGVFFAINFFVFLLLRSYITMTRVDHQYYSHLREVYECISGFNFLLISLAFNMKEHTSNV